MFRKLKRYLRDPYYEIGYDMLRYCPKLMSDKWWISTVWQMTYGYKLDWRNPRTFNEKLQWLKVYDKNPLYTTLVDKLKVKEWVARIIGEEYIIPTLAIYNSVDEINLDLLPNQFVLKCNHDSGSVVVCKNKSTFDLVIAKKKLHESLKRNYYLVGREWPYKNVRPCIFAEQYIEECSTGELVDYKFMFFNNKCKCLFTCTERNSDTGLKMNFYTPEWELLPFTRKYPNSYTSIAKPKLLEKMLSISQMLSNNLNNKFVRIDLYEAKGMIYFGEVTFFPGNGYECFEPLEWDRILGSWIKL